MMTHVGLVIQRGYSETVTAKLGFISCEIDIVCGVWYYRGLLRSYSSLVQTRKYYCDTKRKLRTSLPHTNAKVTKMTFQSLLED